jgi:AraC-like DNA-binding protein
MFETPNTHRIVLYNLAAAKINGGKMDLDHSDIYLRNRDRRKLVPPIIETLYLPQMLNCGFIPVADAKEARAPEILDFTVNRAFGEGFCRVCPIGSGAAITTMDIVYHREMEIIYPQPDYLHLGHTMDNPDALFGHVGRGETYRMVYPGGQRRCSVGVSLLPEFYEEYLKTRCGISPAILTKAVSDLSDSVTLPGASSLLKQLHAETPCTAVGRLRCEGKLLELLAVILDWYFRKERGAPHNVSGADKAAIDEVLSYIRTNYADLTLSALPRVACMSESKLAYTFKRITGGTISEYLRGVRMSAAKELLADSGRGIEQIARMVGFKRHASFTAVFREICGVTPSEYRRAQKDLRRI